jgi:hypothetical protein
MAAARWPLVLLAVAAVRAGGEARLAREYLARFGYLGESGDLGAALTTFQAFAGLRQTGVLDGETVQLMEVARCGVKDVIEDDEDSPRQGSSMIITVIITVSGLGRINSWVLLRISSCHIY